MKYHRDDVALLRSKFYLMNGRQEQERRDREERDQERREKARLERARIKKLEEDGADLYDQWRRNKLPAEALVQQDQSTHIEQDMIQQILDSPKLEHFLHPEVNGRVPVVLSDHLLALPMALSKFGQPVRISEDTTLTKGAFLRFTSMILEDNNAIVEFEYKIEGVGGKCTFDRRTPDGTWALSTMSVWEK